MDFTIREAQPAEFAALGALAVGVYAALPGMPSPAEQPDYYARLNDVGARAGNPAIEIFAAVDEGGAPLGSVDFIGDMAAYGAAEMPPMPDAIGIRLLSVAPAARGRGIGRALTQHCLKVARQRGKTQAILHTTRAMETAWGLYEQLGFQRFEAIDFAQGRLQVFGFKLDL